MASFQKLLVVGWLCAAHAWVAAPSKPLQTRFSIRTLPFLDARSIALYSSSSPVETSPPPKRNGDDNDSNNSNSNSNNGAPKNPRRYNSSGQKINGEGRPISRNGRPDGSNNNRPSFGSNRNNNRPSYGNNNRPNNNNNNSGAAALTLANPLKLQRIVQQTPLSEMTEEERAAAISRGNRQGPPDGNRDRAGGNRDRAGGNRDRPQRGRGPPAPGGVVAADAPSKDVGRGRQRLPVKKKGGTYNKDDQRNRRQSLRVGTGSRKGRGAELSRRRGSLKKRDRSADKDARAAAAVERKTVDLPDGPLSVSELADMLDEKPVAVIKYLMTDLGVMASMTQSLDPSTCIAVVEGFGKFVGGAEDMDEELMDLMAEESALATGLVEDDDDEESLERRGPVVTIMGHVDHGKTSLLDAIRNTAVTAGEAGGITQHIAAYQVKHKEDTITFIDTPGHAAFTDMRERGANITDLVILVVAADDGVKQQTADSIICARQAGVPLVVAINKCDLETADPTKVMTELTAYDVLTEDLGGDVLTSQISAKQGTNLDELLDKVMMQAELQDLKANPEREAEGIVIEAKVKKGLGTVATTLIKKGTLRVGDIFVAGTTYGRVRALISTADSKTRLKEATPSMPVQVVGFEGVPSAGDILVVAKDEQNARELAESRQRISRERQSSSYQDGLMSSVALAFASTKERREMCVVVKADVQGTAEALTRALRELKLENDEAVVTVKVLVSEAGEVSKSDVAIAGVTPGTTVLAFGVAASFAAMEDARSSGTDIQYYNIVYDAIESVESRMQEVLSPTPQGEYVGSAIVQEVFNIGGLGNIAGSRCTDGYLRKGSNVRVMRGDKILLETSVKSLRSFKSEVDNIEEGGECGIGLVDFETFEPGDVVECYVE